MAVVQPTVEQNEIKDAVEMAREVLAIEVAGIERVAQRVGAGFERAVAMILRSPGRVIVCGIGKSGLIGRKIVATLNSTGTRAIFLHPVEAMHGDLGILARTDVVVAISNSGETAEISSLLPSIRHLGAGLIALTGAPNSTLGHAADIVLDVGVEKEACPLGLAPTASTTAALAMGDALAVVLLSRRNFKHADFRALHPAGALGERLKVRVAEVMLAGSSVPRVSPDTSLLLAIAEMSRKRLGATLVVSGEAELLGIITDGDLRRAIERNRFIDALNAADAMTRDPKTICQDALAAEALDLMEKSLITILPIVSAEGRLAGIIHLHDLLGKGRFSFSPPPGNGKA
ncbi:MAG: KpsF/GutQ family sugar-phosphate isomerase [Pseudomonadota bacterium]